MKLESIESCMAVYSAMLQKISSTLQDRKDLCPLDIDNALNYAMKHIYIIPECLGFDPEDYSITLVRKENNSYQFDVYFLMYTLMRRRSPQLRLLIKTTVR